jgi:hypothetical protein
MHDEFNLLVPKEVPVVPPKYNKESILNREVHAGANTINFEDLEGIKKGQ